MARGKASADGVNKMDLVRKAVAALPDATPTQLQAHIKQHHGVELKTMMISSYKSSLRRKEAGGSDASVQVRDLTALKHLIGKLGAPQVQSLIKVLAR